MLFSCILNYIFIAYYFSTFDIVNFIDTIILTCVFDGLVICFIIERLTASLGSVLNPGINKEPIYCSAAKAMAVCPRF